ncbi:MAG: aminodeoxychorismate synthase component I [Spirochaetaceae bacterium]
MNSDVFGYMDELGLSGTPFLFVVDYEGLKPLVWPLESLPRGVRFSVPGVRTTQHVRPRENPRAPAEPIITRRDFVSYERYSRAYDRVQKALEAGESYLVNLTFPTELDLSVSLEAIFECARAPYRLLLPGECVVFSPEAFVRIEPGSVSTYPMKGTIDTAVEHARERLLADRKEAAEHATVVDLLRNDIGMVARRVRVPRFRYVETLHLQERSLHAVSSEIRGTLGPGEHLRVGTILSAMLPAGSITGAPKKRTCEVIAEAESGPRGYYTGVFGVFDGECVESAVMIRYIERSDSGYRFRSGGGVTIYSDCRHEYDEMRQKVDVPVA